MRVISFSLWGDSPKYTVGAVRNAALAAELFPDWVCRFYVGDGVPDKTLGLLANLDNVELSEIPAGFEGWKGMFSRFAPASEPGVEVMLSRDCDSRLSERERDAIAEWMDDPSKTFHCMRDHSQHSVPILGGLWGAKFGAIIDMENLIKEFLEQNLDQNGDYWQVDQQFLSTVVWPKVRHITMCHDDGFFTNQWGGRPFPTARVSGEFVGATYDENDLIDKEQSITIYG